MDEHSKLCTPFRPGTALNPENPGIVVFRSIADCQLCNGLHRRQRNPFLISVIGFPLLEKWWKSQGAL